MIGTSSFCLFFVVLEFSSVTPIESWLAMDITEETSKQSESLETSNSENTTWRAARNSTDRTLFFQAWLSRQINLLDADIHCGVVVLSDLSREIFEPVAVLPNASALSTEFAKSIESAVENKIDEPQLASLSQGQSLILPLNVYGKFNGVVAIQFSVSSQHKVESVVEIIEWGIGWIETYIHRNKYSSSDRLILVLELIATGLHHESFHASATSVATELASALGCERVAIGFNRGGLKKASHCQLAALSHSASFNKKTNAVRSLEAVMDEAIDQQMTIVYPPLNSDQINVLRSHQELSEAEANSAICTVPLSVAGRVLGAIVLERSKGQAFDAASVSLCEHVGSLLGPLLEVKRKDDRWIGKKIGDSAQQQIKNLFGPRHAGLKFSALLITGLILFFAFVSADYRITADARLEGTVQRSVVVPMAGYVVHSDVRAGDVIKKGEELFILDDKDLRLERLKWVGQKHKNTREFNEATADKDRAKARVLAAQIEQAEAEIALLDEQLARTRVTAPFDAFVVSGDLSQSLGAPVERGDVLFQIAPLDSYRVILNVNERDIDDVSKGLIGRLALASAPDNILPIQIEKITPIASAEEGQNYFRVEASLNASDLADLRPGMEGVGKITVEERKILWIWTYKIVHWVRMFMWSWWP